jgi:hypothetical protein
MPTNINSINGLRNDKAPKNTIKNNDKKIIPVIIAASKIVFLRLTIFSKNISN